MKVGRKLNVPMSTQRSKVTCCWFACKYGSRKQGHVIKLVRYSCYTPLLCPRGFLV